MKAALVFSGHGINMKAALVFSGHGIKGSGRIGSVRNYDVAPKIAALLGMDLPDVWKSLHSTRY